MLSISCLLLHNGLFSPSCENFPTMLHPSLYHGLEFYFLHYWHKSHLTAGRKFLLVCFTYFLCFLWGREYLGTQNWTFSGWSGVTLQGWVSSLTECLDPWPCGQAHTSTMMMTGGSLGFLRPRTLLPPTCPSNIATWAHGSELKSSSWPRNTFPSKVMFPAPNVHVDFLIRL